MQEVIIFMDDSGKLSKNESCCVFGGLFFNDHTDYLEFHNKYISIINDIRCQYCKQLFNNCNKNCGEIKATSILKYSDRRRIFNLLKRYKNFGVFIDNTKVYEQIMDDKESRGRYKDFSKKRIIKEIILYLINNNSIDPNKDLIIRVKMDNETTKSNGYYSLESSIYEELVKGIVNYDYSVQHLPLIKGNLTVKVKQYDSKQNYGIQGADFIANYLHRQYDIHLKCNNDISSVLSFIEVKLYMP